MDGPRLEALLELICFVVDHPHATTYVSCFCNDGRQSSHFLRHGKGKRIEDKELTASLNRMFSWSNVNVVNAFFIGCCRVDSIDNYLRPPKSILLERLNKAADGASKDLETLYICLLSELYSDCSVLRLENLATFFCVCTLRKNEIFTWCDVMKLKPSIGVGSTFMGHFLVFSRADNYFYEGSG